MQTDPETVARLREAIAAGDRCTVQLVNYNKIGQPYWTEVELHPARDENGELCNFIALQRDVTFDRMARLYQELEISALKRVSGSTSAADALRRGMLGMAGVLSWAHCACFGVVDGNLEAGEWLGDLGTPKSLIVPETLSEALRAEFLDQETAEPESGDADWTTKSVVLPEADGVFFALACGRPVWGIGVLFIGKNDFGSYGSELVACLGRVGASISTAVQRLLLLRDLEAQKSKAEATAQYAIGVTKQLQEANGKMLDIARSAAVQTMIGGISHQINQPLAALGSYLGILRMRFPTPEDGSIVPESEIIEKAEEQLSRCSRIMQEVRKLGGLEAYGPASMVLRDLVDEAVALSLVRERNAGLRLAVLHSEEPIDVLVESVQLKLVIISLLQNAADASAGLPRRNIEIQTTVTDASWVKVAVSDRGSGVPAGIQKQLFQPFVTTKSGRAGVGLAVCRTIVEANGGSIWHESRRGGGARFCFTLRRRSQRG